jgi:hypothetical protein
MTLTSDRIRMAIAKINLFTDQPRCEQARHKIALSTEWTEEEKTHLLYWLDAREGVIFFDSLPDFPRNAQGQAIPPPRETSVSVSPKSPSKRRKR